MSLNFKSPSHLPPHTPSTLFGRSGKKRQTPSFVSGKQGLPLCILDDVFREFQQQATAPLPSTTEARRALNAAFNLCYTMPNYFAKEADRSEMFDECLDPILPHRSWRKGVHLQGKSEHLGGHVGRIYEQDGVVCILRQDKVETGTGDDVYMQASRTYQLYVESVHNENPTLIKQGAPVFLLCLLGRRIMSTRLCMF